MRLLLACAVALLLAGCGSSNVGPSGSFFAAGGNASERPKLIVVTDFTVSSDLVVIDRSFTARLERKIGAFPTYERKQRTLERVNDEIVATIVGTLRDAGLEADPGSEEGLSLSKAAMVVRGSLRPANPSAKKNEAGIGGGHSGVMADVMLSSLSGFGKKQVLAFSTEPSGGKPPAGKAATAANASIAAALVANKAAPEKLSPDVEAVARKFGRAIGDKIVAYGKAQGWFDAPAPEVAKPEMKPETKPTAKPEAKPEPKPAATSEVRPEESADDPEAEQQTEQVVKLPPKKPARKPAA